MKPLKTQFLNTYGKHKRKLSAWISSDDRKQAFDSTVSSDGSVFEPPKQKYARKGKTVVGRCRAVRPAKEKANRFLTEQSSLDKISSDDENLPPSSRRLSRAKRMFAGVRVSKRIKQRSTETTCDEENVDGMSASPLQLRKQSNATRANSSVGRFVTRRRRGSASKRSVAKAPVSLLSSSDDFTDRDFCSKRIQRPSRRREVLPLSSEEDSLDAAGTSSIANNPLREISLNDLIDHSIGPCARKPIFCSTPSVASISKRAHFKQILSNNRSPTPPSISVSYIRDLSPFQGNRISPKGIKEKSKNKSDVQQLGDPSADMFLENTKGSSSDVPRLKSDGEDSSQFVSAAGAMELVIDALKRKCLTEDSKVNLEKLSGRSSYSSCLEHSNSFHNQKASQRPDAGEKVSSANDSLQALFPSESSVTNSKAEDKFDPKGLSGNISPIESKHPSNPVTVRASTEADKRAAALTTRLKDECASRKFSVRMKKTSLLNLKQTRRLKDAALQSSTDALSSAGVEQTKAWSDSHHGVEEVSSAESNVKSLSSCSDDQLVKPSTKVVRQKKTSIAAREKKCRGVSTDRPLTARKVCVSGMSVSRWKTKDISNKKTMMGGAKTVNCSIIDLIPERQSQKTELLETNMNLTNITPLRTNRLVLSSLLADLTPSTPTWSRLKAALSVHRKVMRTPRFLAAGSPGISSTMADVSKDLFGSIVQTPISKCLQSRSLDQTSLDVCEGADLPDAEKVCAECGQQQPLPWEECVLPERMRRCVKIGEGTFGEVFSTINSSGDTVALKIIPIEGSETVNGEDQKTFGEILHEIIISKELSSLKEKQHNRTFGFIGLNDLHCVRGCYPPDFLKAWDKFDQRKGSENDRPDFFENDQLFIILEFEFGGVDLENSNGTLASLGVAKSILHQVTASLAVAEQELHFEHRDLHWGNVLVKSTKKKKGSFLLNGTNHCMEIKGVLVRIIDYSLSRLEIDDLTVSCDISNDEELFMGQGDYQFEIYRLMRKENGNNWSSYHPHTNVLWLHYLCSKLLSMKYRSSGGKAVKEMQKELTGFHDNVLHYSSATEVLQSCPLFQ